MDSCSLSLDSSSLDLLDFSSLSKETSSLFFLNYYSISALAFVIHFDITVFVKSLEIASTCFSEIFLISGLI